MASLPTFVPHVEADDAPEYWGEWPILFEDDEEGDLGEANLHVDSDEVLHICLKAHLKNRPEYQVFSNMNLYYLDTGNESRLPYVSPDSKTVKPYRLLPESVRSYRIGRDGPAPVLTAEVLSDRSHQQRDLAEKMIVYAKLGVPEYILVNVTGAYLPQRLLLKRLQPDGTYLDERDADGGVTSQLEFRLIIDADDKLRVVDLATGIQYARPDEAETEAQARREAEREKVLAEKRVADLEVESARLRQQLRDRSNTAPGDDAPSAQLIDEFMTKKFYLETIGCQMNVLDSELVVGSLRRQGYELTHQANGADVILFNTCSVRQHAEDKIYSALGRLRDHKRRHPSTVVGVLGCMAQKDQELIRKRAPHVDIICGTGQLAQLPDLIVAVELTGQPQFALSLDRKEASRLEVERSFESYDPLRDPSMRPNRFQAYVRIMIGCDKFCTYCIVPSVRGPEQSRPPEQIAAEVRLLAAEGCKEITLLGQTVNSYQFATADGRRDRLSDLLVRIHETPGIERIKFITNFPRDMSDDLLDTVRELPKVCPYLHVPAQSGCNDVLKRMKRLYTVEYYRDMLARARERVPGIAVSSDFIVGFSGETEESFERTCDLVREAGFKNSFIFKYSARPGTKGHELYADDIPEDVKKRRNNDLLAIQNAVSLQDHLARVGASVNVLVEGPSKNAHKHPAGTGPVQLTGRTVTDHIVVFDGSERLIGETVAVAIDAATSFTLFGTVITHERIGAIGRADRAVRPALLPSEISVQRKIELPLVEASMGMT